jgi:hypothetical protein
MSLWVAFTAERDARLRLERAKRAFAVHGEVSRLLRDHWIVLWVVLFRLEIVVLGGLVVAVWGVGPRIGLGFALAGALLMALAWPTEASGDSARPQALPKPAPPAAHSFQGRDLA